MNLKKIRNFNKNINRNIKDNRDLHKVVAMGLPHLKLAMEVEVEGAVAAVVMQEAHLCPTDMDMQSKMILEMISTNRSRAMETRFVYNETLILGFYLSSEDRLFYFGLTQILCFL